MTDRTSHPPKSASATEVRRRMGAEIALPSRLGHTALLLVGLAGATVAGALLLTEQGLPTRTRIAFAMLVLIGLSWVVFAGWVLARRRVLFATHQLVASRMAVVFTSVFTLGAVLVAFSSDAGGAGIFAGAAGGVMMVVALLLHARARRRVRELTARRDALEREISAAGGAA